MRGKRHAKCDAIARIPSAARAHSIEQHAGAEVDPLIELGGFVITALPGPCKGNECECSRDYPTRRSWNPAPAELGWVEVHFGVHHAEFPPPEPVCLAASCTYHPLDPRCQGFRCAPDRH